MTRFLAACLMLLAFPALACEGHGGQCQCPDAAAGVHDSAHRHASHSAHAAPALTGEPDTDFAAQMIPHHQMGVEMAQEELLYGTDPAMRALAKRILAFQQAEIGELTQWLRARGAKVGQEDSPAGSEHQRIMHAMHRDMAITTGFGPDYHFARSMIPHHRAAIDMAAVQLKYGNDPAMRALARSIVRDQQAEIRWMESWLQQTNR